MKNMWGNVSLGSVQKRLVPFGTLFWVLYVSAASHGQKSCLYAAVTLPYVSSLSFFLSFFFW